MRCEMVKELLEAYMEGELDRVQQESVRIHLAGCESCRNELALTESIPRIVGLMSTPPVPEDIIPNTLKLIHNTPAGWRGQMRAFGAFLSRRWQIVTVACALIVISLLSIGYLRINREPEISAVEIASAEEDVRFALGIVGAATQNMQTATLTTGVTALSVARSTSEDAIRTLSRAQFEVSDKLRRNLSFIAQLQFQEEEQ